MTEQPTPPGVPGIGIPIGMGMLPGPIGATANRLIGGVVPPYVDKVLTDLRNSVSELRGDALSPEERVGFLVAIQRVMDVLEDQARRDHTVGFIEYQKTLMPPKAPAPETE